MTEHQQRRLQNWRLKVLEEAAARGNVAKTCRHYGISRKIFYRWRRRYEAEGLAGLRDRSHVPRHCPRMTDPEFVAKVLYSVSTITWDHGASACICCATTRS